MPGNIEVVRLLSREKLDDPCNLKRPNRREPPFKIGEKPPSRSGSYLFPSSLRASIPEQVEL